MVPTCHPREHLLADLSAAVEPGSPASLLVVFRLGGFTEFMSRSGNDTVESVIDAVVATLIEATAPSGAFYRSRKDELCGLIGGRLHGAEAALNRAARSVNQELAVNGTGISVGYGTAVLPFEADTPLAALSLADQRVTGLADGRQLQRGSAGGVLSLGKLIAA